MNKEELFKQMDEYLKFLEKNSHVVPTGYTNNSYNFEKWVNFERFIKQCKHSEKISVYDIQARFFLYKTDTDLKIIFTHKDKYFHDDKDKRNIYTFVLTRNDKSYTSTFGDSIKNTKEREVPTEYDILSCLEKYPVENFEEFCSMYGYDYDSRKAFSIYGEVKRQSDAVCEMFSDYLDELQDIT